jgi:hypothetical protein
MAPATYTLDQSFPLQDIARQFDDFAPPPRRDAGPLGKLQSADRLVGKSAQDASADRRWSVHGQTSPIHHDGGRSPSNVAAPATV